MTNFGNKSMDMDMEEDMQGYLGYHRDSSSENKGPNSSSMNEEYTGPKDTSFNTYAIGRSNSFTEDMGYTEAVGIPAFGLPQQGAAAFQSAHTPTKMSNTSEILPNNGSALTPTIQGRFEMDFDIAYTIGKGTFGAVYCAKHKVSHVNYAVKKSRRAFTNNFDRNNMLKEVETMAEVSACDSGTEVSHVVQYMGAWIEDDRVFLQMELCDGSVEGMMHQGRIPTPEVYKIVRHMMLALKCIHSKDMCHLDIKPGNILKKGENYKLSDFGLALHINKTGKVRAGDSGSSTVEEGDSRYMPVEMLSWSPVENLTKCDMFSLGISAYELIAHTPVPCEGDHWQLLRSDHWPMPHGVPEEFADYLSCSMRRNPAHRPSAHECLERYSCLKSELEKELSFQKATVQALKDQLLGKGTEKPKLRRHHSVI